MYDFLTANLFLLYFVYGLSFYTMGLVIAVQYRSYSTFRLAYSLSLLAAFAILHGIGEWGSLFVPLRIPELGEIPTWKLIALQRLLQASSHFLLFLFGVKLLSDTVQKVKWLYLVPGILFLGWLVHFSRFILLTGTPEMIDWLVWSENWSRYLLAFPGGLLTAYTLHLQADDLRKFNQAVVIHNLRLATIAFILFAVFSGLVVPSDIGGFSHYLNAASFREVFRIPVEALRAVTAVMAMISISRMLAIFDLEKERQVLEAKRLQVLNAERERFARDLHDGVMQCLYAIGTNLQGVTRSMEENTPEARRKVEAVIDKLQETMKSLRDYIVGLDSFGESTSLRTAVEKVVSEFRQLYPVKIDTAFALSAAGDLKPVKGEVGWINHICQVVREALSNAVRHGGADELEVRGFISGNNLYITVSDNGSGIEPGRIALGRLNERRGVRNMQERALALGGEVRISSRHGGGTEVILTIPVVGLKDVR